MLTSAAQRGFWLTLHLPIRTVSKSHRHVPQEVARCFDEAGIAEWERLVKSPVDEVKLYVHAHYLHAYVPAGVFLSIEKGFSRGSILVANPIAS
jgi:hypothetical protein